MPNNAKSSKPWERQSGESEKAFEAFSLYRNKGADRTLISVAEELQKSYTLIRRWCDRWNWEDRVRDYDNDLEREAKKTAQKGLRDMYTRQTKIAMQVQEKALQALKQLDIEAMSPKDIKEYIRMATELERLNRTLSAAPGESEKAGSGSLADTIIAAYQRRKDGEE